MIYSKQITADSAANNDILYLNTTNENSLLKLGDESVIDLRLQDKYGINASPITIQINTTNVEGTVTYTLSEVYRWSGTTTPTLNGDIITITDASYEGAIRITAKATNATTSRVVLIKQEDQPSLENTTDNSITYQCTGSPIALTETHKLVTDSSIGWTLAKGEGASGTLPTVVGNTIDLSSVHYEGGLDVTVTGLTSGGQTLTDTKTLTIECDVNPTIEITSPINPITDTASTSTALTYTSNVVLNDVNWEIVSYEPSGSLPIHGIPTISSDTSGNPILVIKTSTSTAVDNHFEGTVTLKVSGKNMHGNPSDTKVFDVNCAYESTIQYTLTPVTSAVYVDWDYTGLASAEFTPKKSQHKVDETYPNITSSITVTSINTGTTQRTVGTITCVWNGKTGTTTVYQKAYGDFEYGKTVVYSKSVSSTKIILPYSDASKAAMESSGYTGVGIVIGSTSSGNTGFVFSIDRVKTTYANAQTVAMNLNSGVYKWGNMAYSSVLGKFISDESAGKVGCASDYTSVASKFNGLTETNYRIWLNSNISEGQASVLTVYSGGASLSGKAPVDDSDVYTVGYDSITMPKAFTY